MTVYILNWVPTKVVLKTPFDRIMEMLETEFATYMCLGMPTWSKSLQTTRDKTEPKDH